MKARMPSIAKRSITTVLTVVVIFVIAWPLGSSTIVATTTCILRYLYGTNVQIVQTDNHAPLLKLFQLSIASMLSVCSWEMARHLIDVTFTQVCKTIYLACTHRTDKISFSRSLALSLSLGQRVSFVIKGKGSKKNSGVDIDYLCQSLSASDRPLLQHYALLELWCIAYFSQKQYVGWLVGWLVC
jgi:hypothetical protein